MVSGSWLAEAIPAPGDPGQDTVSLSISYTVSLILTLSVRLSVCLSPCWFHIRLTTTVYNVTLFCKKTMSDLNFPTHPVNRHSTKSLDLHSNDATSSAQLPPRVAQQKVL